MLPFLYEKKPGRENCFQEVVNMVKGISKQVIVLHGSETKLFEQAIFILREGAVGKGITEEALLKEAKLLMGTQGRKKNPWFGAFWAGSGALITGLIWLITILL